MDAVDGNIAVSVTTAFSMMAVRPSLLCHYYYHCYYY